MEKIAWDSSLSIGVDVIDEQHKMLINRLNDLSAALREGRGEGEIGRTLDFLAEYTDFHFSAEEELMKEQEYPGLPLQKHEHKAFREILSNLVDDFQQEGATWALARAIDAFLFNWLVKHIKGVDLQLGDYLRDKGVVPK